MLLSTVELSFLKTTGIEICPKEPFFLVLMTKLGLKPFCLLEDKQVNQYALVGNTRVRNTNTELSNTSRVACIKGTFQIQRIMMLSSPVCLLEKCIYGLQQWGGECYFQLWNSPS